MAATGADVAGRRGFDDQLCASRKIAVGCEDLEAEAEVLRMRDDIAQFIATWLPCYVRDNRSYLTVGIGCTGGQHRSVYFAEWLGRHFSERARVLVRHRELSPAPNGRA
jgi:RNase adaptor protein for sRNA GlmZ degradation